jgi:hypothetical protein
VEPPRDPARVQAAHEERRASILEQIPARYSPALHLALPTALGLSVLAGALVRMQPLRPIELLTVPLTLFAGFGFEWRAHKDILHRRIPGLSVLYERHEKSHHVIYTDHELAMRSPREMWLILMPPYAILLVFLVLVAPLALTVERLVGTNVAMLMTATSMMFFLSYEWMHLAYHLPATHPVGRLGVVAKLREHHRRHHEPRLMKRWNFNVTLPLFDWIHRTTWSPEREARADAARAAKKRARGRVAEQPSS